MCICTYILETHIYIGSRRKGISIGFQGKATSSTLTGRAFVCVFSVIFRNPSGHAIGITQYYAIHHTKKHQF